MLVLPISYVMDPQLYFLIHTYKSIRIGALCKALIKCVQPALVAYTYFIHHLQSVASISCTFKA